MNDVTETALPGKGIGASDHAMRQGIRHLGDFTTSPRVLFIAAIALVVGTGGMVSGVILLKLIRLVTNLAYFGAFSLADLPARPVAARPRSPSWSRSSAR